jgi:Tfp pilus assembly protein PilX
MKKLHARQDGFTMVVVMLVLLIGTLVSVAAWQSVNGDAGPAQQSIASKRAYAAAQAGLADYLQKLGSDNEYWLKCATVGSPVNQPWNGTGADPRSWRAFGPSPNTAYTTELIPQSGYTQCDPTNDKTMLSSSGTIQIRTTGRSGVTGVAQRKRSIVTTLRRNGFLDFLYFTKYEESDPAQKILSTGGLSTRTCTNYSNHTGCSLYNLANWADQATTCDQYVREGRDNVTSPGEIETPAGSNRWYSSVNGLWPIGCGNIQFLGTDVNNGPLHSNDTISICGSPTFGRNRNGNGLPIDRVEYWDYDQTCSGTAGPNNGGNSVTTGTSPSFPLLDLPQSNTALRQVAQQDNAVYYGQTTITLKGATMDITKSDGTTLTNQAYPAHGVIYVAAGQTGTCPPWNVLDPYDSTPSQTPCGDVIVKGTYGNNLTIGTERDVLITGDITMSNNSLLGLIANNYIRVQHRVQSYPCDGSTANLDSQTNRSIQAAMLSLGHVFTVDNYQCGDNFSNLSVTGAIAQKFRGPVGTHSGSTVVSGYTKNYTYDDRLKYRSPPYFLAPVQSAWRVVRTSEQSPPR